MNNVEIACRIYSDSGGIQTHDLQNRNLTLYSAKLRSHKIIVTIYIYALTLNFSAAKIMKFFDMKK